MKRRLEMESILKRQHKRGQAAMEFLMTYGWAILAAIIAIGVQAYFGVFNPGKLAGSAGIVNAPFNMDAFNIKNVGVADTISMEITQNSGTALATASVTATPKQGVTTGVTFVCA